MFEINREVVIKEIKDNFPNLKILIDEPMKNHTTFKIGSNAFMFISVTSDKEILDLIKFLKNKDIPYTIIGNGSNMLISDNLSDRIFIHIGSGFSSVKFLNDDTVYASSGVLLSKLANIFLENHLTGFEFASGIPGTLGGAILMNAGAYDGEIKDVVTTVTYLDKNGDIKTVDNKMAEFSYRKSRFTKDDVILGATIKLKKGNYDDIKSIMADLNSRRREKQPLEYPSAGSTFKRPKGYFAAKLIDDAGLRGYSIGGAMVSDKHTGFVINSGNASFDDVINVINHVKKIVKDKFNVELEEEVKIIY